jgi:FlaA1/EpsC-like NDP-sugar epimerase
MRRPILVILWLATDYLLFLAAYGMAYFYRVGWILSSDLPFAHYMTAVAVSAAVWLVALAFTRTFSVTVRQRTLGNAAVIGFVAVIGAALVASLYFFLFQRVFSRLLLLSGLILSTVFIWCWHIAFGLLMRVALRAGAPVYPTLLVGVTSESRALLKLLQERRSVLKPVAILDAAGVKETEIEHVPVLGKLNKLEDVLRDLRITHVLQCSDLEQTINLLGACRAHGITYMLLPSVLGIVERDERMESLEGKAVTVVSPGTSWWNWLF